MGSVRSVRVGRWVLALLVACPLAAAAGPASLVEAVKAGDPAAVRALLRTADVNVREADGTTALHWASNREDVPMVDLLLRAGADARAVNRFGVTPLSVAAQKGNAAILTRLLDAGADPNVTMTGGETPLMTAARVGLREPMRVLVARGAAVDAREATRGQTALMWAAAAGNTEAVKVLIEAGANVNLRATGPPQREGAARARGGRLDSLNALLFASRRGHLESVRLLLDAGANIRDTAADGSGPVALAIANAHFGTASLLLDRGADPNASTEGWTALHQLTRIRRPSIARMAPPVGFDSPAGIELAKKLVAKGANVNARMTRNVNDTYRHVDDRKGATPFYLAAKGLDTKMMGVLLGLGADPRLPTEEGSTPLMAAVGFGDTAPGEAGTEEDGIEATKALLAVLETKDVNAVNDNGWSALHAVAFRGSVPIARLLIAKGAQLDAEIYRGYTALGIATGWRELNQRYEQLEVAALLREEMSKRGLKVDGFANSGLPFDGSEQQ